MAQHGGERKAKQKKRHRKTKSFWYSTPKESATLQEQVTDPEEEVSFNYGHNTRSRMRGNDKISKQQQLDKLGSSLKERPVSATSAGRNATSRKAGQGKKNNGGSAETPEELCHKTDPTGSVGTLENVSVGTSKIIIGRGASLKEGGQGDGGRVI